jgi:hypothetical protein
MPSRPLKHRGRVRRLAAPTSGGASVSPNWPAHFNESVLQPDQAALLTPVSTQVALAGRPPLRQRVRACRRHRLPHTPPVRSRRTPSDPPGRPRRAGLRWSAAAEAHLVLVHCQRFSIAVLPHRKGLLFPVAAVTTRLTDPISPAACAPRPHDRSDHGVHEHQHRDDHERVVGGGDHVLRRYRVRHDGGREEARPVPAPVHYRRT